MTQRSSVSLAGGFPIAIGAIAGAFIGLVNDQPTIGLLIGMAIGVALAILLWLRSR